MPLAQHCLQALDGPRGKPIALVMVVVKDQQRACLLPSVELPVQALHLVDRLLSRHDAHKGAAAEATHGWRIWQQMPGGCVIP